MNLKKLVFWKRRAGCLIRVDLSIYLIVAGSGQRLTGLCDSFWDTTRLGVKEAITLMWDPVGTYMHRHYIFV